MGIEEFEAKAAAESLILAHAGPVILGGAFAALRGDCVYVGKVAVPFRMIDMAMGGRSPRADSVARGAVVHEPTIALRTSAAGLRAWQAHLAAFPEITVTVEDHQVAVSIYFSDPDGNPYEITTYEVGKR